MRFRDVARVTAYAGDLVSQLGPAFTFQRRDPRHPGLDCARGLAVMAMVIGHTLDAVLSPAVRADVWVQHYWTCRGITAPLFLMVAGWAVVAALGSKPTAARDTYGKRVRRALLLIFLGYLMHWPGWSTVIKLGLTEEMLTKVFVFDALQCIGFAILAGATLLAVTPGRWGRTVMLVAVAVGIPLVSVSVRAMSEGLPGPLTQLIGTGGTSRFAFFPWASYFFAGAVAASLLGTLRPGVPQGLALLILGSGLFWFMRAQPQDWGPASAWLVAYRVGQGMMVLGAVNILPRKVSGLLAPLGRLSLWVYVLHLPIVYGWSSYAGLSSRVGQTLTLPEGLGIGVSLLVACALVARLGTWLRDQARPWRTGSTTLEASVGSLGPRGS
ncbi:acyltransferase family protein [Myxococcus vastator]|uniref:acyltransferase family protein n=1 Tax=Myxococcus vastator TaxID=2709664 RepID=UPI0013D4D106|nr:acyltransferase [Myxococcus vastator]